METSDIISIVGLAVKLLEIFVPLVNKKNEKKPKKNDKSQNRKLKKQKNQTDSNNEFKNKFTLNVKNPLPKDSLRNLGAKKLSENLNVINKNLREYVYRKHFIEYSKEERLLKVCCKYKSKIYVIESIKMEAIVEIETMILKLIEKIKEYE